MSLNIFQTIRSILILVCVILLSACQSTPLIERYQEEHGGVSATNSTGFLSDYSKLKQVEGEDGQQVLRWVNPQFKPEQYTKIKVLPLVVLPIQKQSVDIPKEKLGEIQHYFDTALRAALSEKYTLSDASAHDVVQVKAAITNIKLEAEGMKVTEVLPYGAVIGLIRTATDTRNQEVTVVLEVELTNSLSGETEVSLLRVGEGEDIKMLWDANFSLHHVQELLDEWVLLATTSF
mgnify:CR=1 FL=1